MSILSRTALAVALVLGAPGAIALAQAQTKPQAAAPAQSGADDQAAMPKQVQLTQKQIDGYLAATPELDKVVGQDSDGPKPADLPKLETIAKAHGFDDYKQYSDVSYTIGIVIDGLDPSSKAYVGPKAVLTEEIKQLTADKSVPAKDKAEQLSDLKDQLKASDQEEKPMPANIDLVKQNFDKLSAASQSD